MINADLCLRCRETRQDATSAQPEPETDNGEEISRLDRIINRGIIEMIFGRTGVPGVRRPRTAQKLATSQHTLSGSSNLPTKA